MIKVVPPDSWDFGDEPLRLVKVASTGLRGRDLNDLVRRSDGSLAEWVKRALAEGRKLPGEVWAHAIAMSAHESGGHNRNFDTWYEDDLKKDAHTFETLGRAFRQHANSDPKKSYGIIKKAHYNPTMRRVELIMAYNGTKEAADRTGGLVADKEVQDLESNKPFPGSMSTKIHHDTCLCCGNEAKHRSEYCDGDCPGGGMKKRAGRVLEDGRIVAVSNHGNRFFDYSRVHRHADRTAAVLGKVASHVSDAVGGAELAERLGLSCPWWLLDTDHIERDVLARVKLARDLAAAAPCASEMDLAFTKEAVSRVPCEPLTLRDDREVALLLKAFAKSGTIVSPQHWLELIAGPEATGKVSEVIAAYPAARAAMPDDPGLTQRLRDAAFPLDRIPDHLSKWAAHQSDLALTPEIVAHRIALATVRGAQVEPRKTASDASPAAKELAQRYLAYQVNALELMGGDPFLVECAARMGEVSF